MDQFIEFAQREWLLFAALAAILVALVVTEVRRKILEVSAVTPIQALQLMNHEDAVTVDVRALGEYQQGHIPQARHLPAAALKERLGELERFKDRPVILYCRAGNHSAAAAATLKKSGFQSARSLSGGLLAWERANLPLSKK